jgi:hypothetical protein
VLLRELFIREEAKPKIPPMLGRPFNHPEHYVIFHGVSGILEALQHFDEIKAEPKQLRFKWDGNPQIYWGREKKNGPLVLAGHNGWGKGGRNTGTTMDDFTSPEAVQNFILNKSGEGAKGQEITPERQRFATEFANLYPIFDAATPKDFVGFIYADAIFMPATKPEVDESGVYNMHPNPHSATEYHVSKDSDLGKRVADAQLMIAAHGTFDTFGAPDSAQKPRDDFSEFNGTTDLIVLDPIYNGTAPTQAKSGEELTVIKDVKTKQTWLEQNGPKIDQFVGSISHTDKNGIFYPFLNQKNAAGTFEQITPQIFFDWMAEPQPNGKPRVSLPKQQALDALEKQTQALGAVFHAMKVIRDIKHDIYKISNDTHDADVWSTNSEGYVRYAQDNHKHGNMKIVAPGWKN